MLYDFLLFLFYKRKCLCCGRLITRDMYYCNDNCYNTLMDLKIQGTWSGVSFGPTDYKSDHW